MHRWHHHSYHSRFLHCLLTGVHSVAQCAGSHETTSRFVTGRRRRWKPAAEFSRQTWLVTEWGGYPQQDKLLKTEKFVISTVFLQCCSMFECYLRGEKLFSVKSRSSHIKSSMSCPEIPCEDWAGECVLFSFRNVIVKCCRPPLIGVTRKWCCGVPVHLSWRLIFLFMFCGVPFSDLKAHRWKRSVTFWKWVLLSEIRPIFALQSHKVSGCLLLSCVLHTHMHPFCIAWIRPLQWRDQAWVRSWKGLRPTFTRCVSTWQST